MSRQVYDMAAVRALCQALGQDPADVERIVIDIRAGDVPRVHFTRLTGPELPLVELLAGLEVHCRPEGCSEQPIFSKGGIPIHGSFGLAPE